MPKEKKRIFKTAIYCRLSKEDGDKVVSNSIEGQISFCKDFVNRDDELKLAYEPFIDDGVSGVSLNRPAFNEMDKLVREGKIDCIVCRDLSRFTRDYVLGGEYAEKTLYKLGVRFIAINDCDTFKDDPQALALKLPMMNLINDNYSRDTSKKIRSSLATRRKNGEYVGAFAPYGYKKSETDRHQLVPDEEATVIVQKIFSHYKNGYSMVQIAKQLNDMGILSPAEHKQVQGTNLQTSFKVNEVARWEQNTIRRILKNEVYIGVLVQGKVSTKNYKLRKKEPVPEKDWVTVENAHEPLVSVGDFLAVQEMMTRNVRIGKGCDTVSLLSGFIYCADCGATMIKKTTKSGGKEYHYYICSDNRNFKTCSSHSIGMKDVEEKVLKTIRDQVEIVCKMEEVLNSISENSDHDRATFTYETQITALEEEIQKYNEMKLKLYEDKVDGIITDHDFVEFKQSFSIKIKEKEQSILNLKKIIQDSELTGTSTNNWTKLFQETKDLQEIDRPVLMNLVDKVLIHENHMIEIVFKYQADFQEVQQYILLHYQKSQEKEVG
ncbi:MAG: recombinase family protein [Eubacteriales bacterium]